MSSDQPTPPAPVVPQGAVALFLDFDGTLVDIAPTPRSVKVEAALRGLLNELSVVLGGALAVVTGRRLDSLDEFLAPPVLSAAGLHGAQLRLSPTAAPVTAAPPLPKAAAALEARYGRDPAMRIEDKGVAVALHFRGAPQRAAEAEAALREAVAGLDVEIIAGKCVFEARPPGFDKGTALRAFMAEPAFAGRMPIFAGDDITDEDGMQAALALGGSAIKIGAGPSIAPTRLADPAALHVWLSKLLAVQRGGVA
jgi:trehalose 6-phosphate phosphatase